MKKKFKSMAQVKKHVKKFTRAQHIKPGHEKKESPAFEKAEHKIFEHKKPPYIA